MSLFSCCGCMNRNGVVFDHSLWLMVRSLAVCLAVRGAGYPPPAPLYGAVTAALLHPGKSIEKEKTAGRAEALSRYKANKKAGSHRAPGLLLCAFVLCCSWFFCLVLLLFCGRLCCDSGSHAAAVILKAIRQKKGIAFACRVLAVPVHEYSPKKGNNLFLPACSYRK